MLFWNRLKFLKENEAWGSPEKMSGLLLFALDVIREELKCPVIIHCGWSAGTGHAPNSYHYSGLACDFHIEGGSLSYNAGKIVEILNNLGVLNYGLGAYPEWGTPGFHLDLRPTLTYWVSTEKGRYTYFKNPDIFIKAISV